MALPKKQADKYENVDVMNFSTADKMSREELITMGEIASSRGESNAALRWKAAASERVRVEDNKQNVDQMLDAFTPKPVPPPGRILEPEGAAPWESDSEFKKLKRAYTKAKKTVDESRDADWQLTEKRNDLANAHDAMKSREHDLRAELSASGAFTEQDQRVLDATESMASKGAQVAALFDTEQS